MLKKLLKLYSNIAFITLNTIILFIFINILSSLHICHKNNTQLNKIFQWYGNNIDLSSVYPEMNSDEINDLLNETWTRTYSYEPYTQFKERPFTGKYLNVSKFGFRTNGYNPPWPPKTDSEIIIFIFGGSTTFGYGVPDDQTIPAYLEKYLNDRSSGKNFRIYNFGRGYYFSSQERVLLEYLLERGYIPNIALFIDGLNDFYQAKDDGPEFSLMLKSLLDEELYKRESYSFERFQLSLKNFLLTLPVVQLFYSAQFSNMSQEFHKNANFESPELLEYIVKRYLKNKIMIEALGEKFNFKTEFIFQPVPSYKYDTDYHIFKKFGYGVHEISKYGYPYMKEYISKRPMDKNFLWLADIQEEIKQPLYVDSAHYSGYFCSIIAKEIISKTEDLFITSELSSKKTEKTIN